MLSNLPKSKLISAKRLKLKENRKRVVFVLKFILFLFLVYIQIRYPRLGEDYGFTAFYIEVILFYLKAHLIISISRLILVYIYIKRNQLKDDFKDNFILAVNRIASLLSFIAVLLTILFFFRVDPKELLTSLSIVAVALTLIFKDYISNLINGMIIMFSDQFSLNDYIKIGEHKGRIIDINLVNVQLKTEDEEIIYIPNNIVFTKEVINYSKRNYSLIVVEFDLTSLVSPKLPLLENFLNERLQQHFSQHIKPESSSIKIVKIKKDEVLVKYIVSLNKQNARLEKLITRFCFNTILEFLVREQIPLSESMQEQQLENNLKSRN